VIWWHEARTGYQPSSPILKCPRKSALEKAVAATLIEWRFKPISRTPLGGTAWNQPGLHSAPRP
jgi:hypothetical protein